MSAPTAHELSKHVQLAMEAGEITLAYQPIVALPSGRLMGFEALARWNSSVFGNIPPLDFLPAVVESGQSRTFSRLVISSAIRALSDFTTATGRSDLVVAINATVDELLAADPASIEALCNEVSLEPNRILLEVTEEAPLFNRPDVHAQLKELKALGIETAIDDFGTGYASLRYLKQFHFDIMKIDRAFVEDLASEAGRRLMEIMLSIGPGLEIQTVVEGIETMQQLKTLTDLGADAAQGYLFSRPLQYADVMVNLQSWSEDGFAAICAEAVDAPAYPGA